MQLSDLVAPASVNGVKCGDCNKLVRVDYFPKIVVVSPNGCDSILIEMDDSVYVSCVKEEEKEILD